MEGEVLTTEPPGMPPGQVVLTLPRKHRTAQDSLEPSCPDLILCPFVVPQPDLSALQIYEPFQGIGKKDWGAEGTAHPHRRHRKPSFTFPCILTAVSSLLELKKRKKERTPSSQAETFRRQGGHERGHSQGRGSLRKGFFKFLKL